MPIEPTEPVEPAEPKEPLEPGDPTAALSPDITAAAAMGVLSSAVKRLEILGVGTAQFFAVLKGGKVLEVGIGPARAREDAVSDWFDRQIAKE